MKGKRSMSMKMVVVLLAVVLLIGGAIGGTLAWLMDSTETVTNTFTTSDVDIELVETKGPIFQMVPGKNITKDPKVIVKATSEDCYVFVKVEESENFQDYMNYQIDNEWDKVLDENEDPIDGVYYLIATDIDDDKEVAILADNVVSVKDNVTKEMMKAVDGKDENGNAIDTEKAPELAFTAYAIQKDNLPEGISIYEIWGMAQNVTAANP